MTYYEFTEQFWQLYGQRRLSPMATTLYFYLLNEFNTARPVHWPARLYRRATQVYADLGVDKKTLARAIDILEERGLIRHYAGDHKDSGEWQLNYGPAAAWANSVGKNSPPTATECGEKFPTACPESGQGKGKNSPPIRNRPEEEKTPPPSAGVGACVGEAAEKIARAPLPTDEVRLVPPVAEPPHAAESRSVAAAEQPADALAEYKTLALRIGAMWGFTPQKGQASLNRLYQFVRRLAGLGHLDELRQQLAGYQNGGHLRPGERGSPRPHGFASWLGTAECASGPYRDGEWCGRDWPGLAAARLGTAGGAAPPATRAATAARNSPTQKW